MDQSIKTEIKDDVCTLTINNPPMNIITQDVREELVPFMESLKTRKDVRAIIITGTGEKSFCAGADLNEEGDLTQETVHHFLEEDCRVYDIMHEMPQPVIAAINGYCFGGGFELALAADIRIASTNAKLCAAGVKVGLVASPTRLVRLVGEGLAKEIILTGKTYTAEEMLQKNLLTNVVEQEALLKEAHEWANMISRRAPIAVSKAKDTIQKTTDMTYSEAMAMELKRFVECQATWDHKHAIESFFNKEKPRFRGE